MSLILTSPSFCRCPLCLSLSPSPCGGSWQAGHSTYQVIAKICRPIWLLHQYGRAGPGKVRLLHHPPSPASSLFLLLIAKQQDPQPERPPAWKTPRWPSCPAPTSPQKRSIKLLTSLGSFGEELKAGDSAPGSYCINLPAMRREERKRSGVASPQGVPGEQEGAPDLRWEGWPPWMKVSCGHLMWCPTHYVFNN